MKLDKKQLKEILRPIVKELVLETFAGMHISNIIENSIQESFQKINLVKETGSTKPKVQQNTMDLKIQEKLLANRRKMLDALHTSNIKSNKLIESKSQPSTISEILAETESSGFEIQDSDNTNPEFVSEDTLEQLTEGKDYSKFIG